MKSTTAIVMSLIAGILLSSCYTYTEVIKISDPANIRMSEHVHENIEPGDLIDIKTTDRTYRDVRVASLSNSFLTVSIKGSNEFVKYLNIQWCEIQELSVRDMDPVYTIGGPFVVILLLLYLAA